jgi:hypothetical protein
MKKFKVVVTLLLNAEDEDNTTSIHDGVNSMIESAIVNSDIYSQATFETDVQERKTHTVYNVTFFDKDGESIDSTQVDENPEKNEGFVWELFEEFGHEKEEGTYFSVEEVESDDYTDEVEKAENYLSDGSISTAEMIRRIEKHEDQYDFIDNVGGVVVWEKVQNSFTCEEFLNMISN